MLGKLYVEKHCNVTQAIVNPLIISCIRSHVEDQFILVNVGLSTELSVWAHII